MRHEKAPVARTPARVDAHDIPYMFAFPWVALQFNAVESLNVRADSGAARVVSKVWNRATCVALEVLSAVCGIF